MKKNFCIYENAQEVPIDRQGSLMSRLCIYT